MANKKDFAIGIIANNPGTSGTSLELQAGYGQVMPPVPFYLTLSPPGQLSTLANAEKVLVTARPGNAEIFTMTRAQSPTTVKNIAAGWIAVNSVYVEDVESVGLVTGETPVGAINGTNTAYTIASPYTQGSLRVFKNGVRMRGGGNDYTETVNGFTTTTAPTAGTILLVDYNVNRTGVNTVGSNSFQTDETVTGAVNGVNAAFTTQRPYIAGSLSVFVNGLRQAKTTHVTESNPGTGAFTLDVAPLTGDVVRVDYQFNQNPSSNADTVDGIHANTTATAGNLYPLNSDARFPNTLLTEEGCELSHSVSQSLPTGTLAIATFDTEAQDSNSFHSTTVDPSRITVPTKGKYLFTANVTYASNNIGLRFTWFVKNGVTSNRYSLVSGAPVNGDSTGHCISRKFTLNAGDYIEVYVYQNSGGALNLLGDNSAAGFIAFTCTRLGA